MNKLFILPLGAGERSSSILLKLCRTIDFSGRMELNIHTEVQQNELKSLELNLIY